jgi:hypothetical protein
MLASGKAFPDDGIHYHIRGLNQRHEINYENATITVTVTGPSLPPGSSSTFPYTDPFQPRPPPFTPTQSTTAPAAITLDEMKAYLRSALQENRPGLQSGGSGLSGLQSSTTPQSVSDTQPNQTAEETTANSWRNSILSFIDRLRSANVRGDPKRKSRGSGVSFEEQLNKSSMKTAEQQSSNSATNLDAAQASTTAKRRSYWPSVIETAAPQTPPPFDEGLLPPGTTKDDLYSLLDETMDQCKFTFSASMPQVERWLADHSTYLSPKLGDSIFKTGIAYFTQGAVNTRIQSIHLKR